jgi:hypothetical protein
MTAYTTVCVKADSILVCPDWKIPPEPGGRVNRRPGLRAMKRPVVTRRSVLVRTRPIACARRLYTRKKTRAWKNTAIWFVFRLVKETLVPSVVKRIPGLSARNRAAGIATFWDVNI